MNATEHLDGLADALAAAGWSTRARYESSPQLIHVFAPDVPQLGESVYVKAGVGGVPWFIASTGDPVAPCHDIAGAVAELGKRLEPLAMAAAIAAEPPRPRLSVRAGRIIMGGFLVVSVVYVALGLWVVHSIR